MSHLQITFFISRELKFTVGKSNVLIVFIEPKILTVPVKAIIFILIREKPEKQKEYPNFYKLWDEFLFLSTFSSFTSVI